MSLDTLKSGVANAVQGLRNELLSLSHSIHSKPELALQEFKASKLLADGVERHGLTVQRETFGLKTSYAAEFGGRKGPTIAILSEYDALPGIGHACGHNIIAAAGFGAAIALSKLGVELPGRIRYLGTPAEERYSGKEIMARAGAFEKLDAALMIHPATANLITMPCIALAEVEAVFYGRAAHASSSPYRGLNALDAVVSAYQSLAQLRQHIHNSERIHGIITEGGLAPNIVPERAACRYYIRSPDADGLAALKPRVEACFQGAAIATGCRAELRWLKANLELKTSWSMAGAFERNAVALGRTFFPLKDVPSGHSGSTDMGNVSHRVPSIHPLLAVSPPDIAPHDARFTHSAASADGDKAVIDGATALAMTVLDLLYDEQLRERVKVDFEAASTMSQRAIAVSQETLRGSTVSGGCGCA